MLFGAKFSNVLNGIGAGLKDVHGSGNVAAFQNQLSQMQQRQKQAQLVAQLQGGQQPFTPGINGNQGVPSQGGGQNGGLSQQQLSALAQLNPQAFAAAQAKAHFAGPTVVAGGSSVFQNGQFRQAPQNFQNGSRVGTLGANGFQSHDLGQNQAEANTAFANQTTRQNNLATQGLKQNTLAETIRNNDLDNANTQFANQTGRLNANTARFEAENGGGAAGQFGLTPVFGRDENGNRVLIQTNKAGGVRTAGLPEGVTLEDDQFRSSARAQGKVQGESAANLPSVINNAGRTLDTVEDLLNHPGLEAGTGFSSVFPAIPGTSRKAFDVANKQLGGQVFLQGFEALKGGGVITEVEGLKAEQALARADQAQSQEDYTAALNDYRNIVANGVASSFQKAGQPIPKRFQDIIDQATPPSTSGGLSAAEQAELAELERQFGGQ